MESLKNMSNAKLKSLATAAQAEIDRREAARKALDEVEGVLNRYGVELSDLTNNQSNSRKVKRRVSRKKNKKNVRSTGKSTKAANQRKAAPDRRSAVKPKYKNPESSETWSGRGRSPKWVSDICEAEKLSVTEFKADHRFTQV